jgi:hypothetical protein
VATTFESELNSKHFENKLTAFSSGLGNIAKELLQTVGDEMAAKARSKAATSFHNRSGKLLHSINFIAFDEKTGALTTKKNLNKANIYYARFVEKGAEIKPKKGKYLTFKIDGEWKKVESVKIKPRPFMTPTFDEYWNGPNAKGYIAMADALEKKMNEYLD